MIERWMKDIHDRLADCEKPAPEGLFADVQQEMQRRGLFPVEEKRGKFIPMWVKGAVVAASVAVVLGLSTLLLFDNENVVNNYDVQTIVNVQPNLGTQPKQEVQIIPSNEKQTHENSKRRDMLADQVQTKHVSPMINQEALFEGEADEKNEINEEVVVEEEEIQKIEIVNVPTTKSTQPKDQSPVTKNIQSSLSNRKPSTGNGQSKWQVGVNVSGIRGISTPYYNYLTYIKMLSKSEKGFYKATVNPSGEPSIAQELGSYYRSAGNLPEDVDPVVKDPIKDQQRPKNFVDIRFQNYDLVLVNNRLTIVRMNAHHRQPVKLGLSLRYNINNIWSVQTGIDYSYHSSDLISQIDNCQIQSEQKLHFIGLPMALSYSLWSPGKFNFYLSAGGEVEKVIKGSRTSLRVAPDNADQVEREDVEQKPWQLSVMGSGGVQFNVSHLLSLYAEPGVGYYFNNHSSLPTIYQEKPLNFNLNLGIRFNIQGKQQKELKSY